MKIACFIFSPVNLPAWRPKDTNVTLMSFVCLFTEKITPEKKIIKIEEIREELSTSH